jgi:hypothetical protein
MNEEDPTPRFLLGTLAAVATLLGATVISEAALGAYTHVGPKYRCLVFSKVEMSGFPLSIGQG